MDELIFWFNKKKLIIASGVTAFIVGSVVIGPFYKIWHQQMEGRAKLAESEFSKQVLIQEAKAKEEAAKYQAQTEITRAEGVAKANKIIGESLKDNSSYLHYLWLQNLEAGNHDVIYIPTEAGMPIFEAGGRHLNRSLGAKRASNAVEYP